MNILHMKYAVEVARTGSISKAAEKLYTGQPNISRAIKELENSLNITIFSRTPQGMIPTPMGEEFLSYAKLIISQLDEMEARYSTDRQEKQMFQVSIPRASYLSDAFMRFVRSLDLSREIECRYHETNSLHAVNNILEAGYGLGIIRFQSAFEPHFSSMLEEKGLRHELIWEFEYELLLSDRHPLADAPEIRADDLAPYVEIAHGDPYVPTDTMAGARPSDNGRPSPRSILIHERSIQFELLREVRGAYMWTSPIPPEMLRRHGLRLRRCAEGGRRYQDVLIYRKNHILSELEERFIAEVHAAAARLEC